MTGERMTAMKITASLPFDRLDPAGAFTSAEAVRQIGSTLERAGFDGGTVTDHPCPTGRWLDSGGHHAQDPFVMLALLAQATTTLRLQTGILVLPYRNPFITARAVATLDLFSGGRVVLGVGVGYLKGEYRALGVDFEQRNALMDEYLVAMKTAWGQDEFTFEGSDYTAFGNRISPRPARQPELLIGGNSQRAIRRAVAFGDGWYPFFNPGPMSATTRTATMADDEDLLRSIAYLRQESDRAGRSHPPTVHLGSLTRPGAPWDGSALLDRIGALDTIGVRGVVAHIDGRDRAEWCDNAERFGAEIIAKIA